MTPWCPPPTVARWLVERALPADLRESVTGDLDEVFQRDCRHHGPAGARRRYWRQALSFTLHFVLERWRDRRRGGLMRIGLSWLDFKLGFRMLVRYPMLTVVGSLAMAVAIGVGAATFEVSTRVTDPSLPLPDGGRIVGLNFWHRAESGPRAGGPYDVLAWREGLRTVEDIGAFRLVRRNLIVGEQVGEPVDAAEISAAALRVAGVRPLLGRALLDEDEAPESPAVVVLGHRVWTLRFGADPAVLGREVRLGSTPATVVGVMPDGFVFPIRQGLWTPLRLRHLPPEPGQGPPVRVVGRLAPGIDLTQAQAELQTVGSQVARQFPKPYEHLQPRVLPYAESIAELLDRGDGGAQVDGVAADDLRVEVVIGVAGRLDPVTRAAEHHRRVVGIAFGAPRHSDVPDVDVVHPRVGQEAFVEIEGFRLRHGEDAAAGGAGFHEECPAEVPRCGWIGPDTLARGRRRIADRLGPVPCT